MISSTGARALTVAGALFVLYPAVRPWSDATAEGSAAAFASPWWPVAHLAAVAGFVLVGVGLLTLRDLVAGRPGARAAGAALGIWTAGAALVLPYYGAETFALHALGGLSGTGIDVPALAEAVRMGPVQVVAFAAGLLLLAAGAVLAAVAVVRAGLAPAWRAALWAAGFALYLPQFFLSPEVRIAHGVLVGVGCVLLATTLRPRIAAPTAPRARAAA
jgi:hypothetical protein